MHKLESFASQPVGRTIWSNSDKVSAEIALFLSQAVWGAIWTTTDKLDAVDACREIWGEPGISREGLVASGKVPPPPTLV